jgi:small ligand-binding sensory domain FIST
LITAELVGWWFPQVSSKRLPAETFRLDFLRTDSGGLFTGYRFDTDGA